jgi:hypothetical protein
VAARDPLTARVAAHHGGVALAIAIGLVALTPDVALAWTPGTHIFLGEAVLRSLHLLPGNTAQLIAAFPYDFLYGSIAADTSIAKKYAAAGRHCHSWKVGREILEAARNEQLRAFGLGYMAHLAADVVAHNFFVPRQLTLTSATSALGHSYWESRFEMHLPEGFSARARAVILRDHSRADEHLDRILAPTLFSTPTNRRIFRGMVRAADSESWQRIFQILLENSRWDLPDDDTTAYMSRSFDYIIDLLTRLDESEPHRYDPAGRSALRLSKRVRRWVLKRASEERIPAEAERYFALPESHLEYSVQLDKPILQLVDATG